MLDPPTGAGKRAAQPRDPTTYRRGRHPTNRASIIRLVGAVLAQQHDESAEVRRYLGVDVLARARAVATSLTEEVIAVLTIQAITA